MAMLLHTNMLGALEGVGFSLFASFLANSERSPFGRTNVSSFVKRRTFDINLLTPVKKLRSIFFWLETLRRPVE